MGGIVSQNRGDGHKVVSLDGVNKKMRLYQHATTSEVLVLYDQHIGDYVGNSNIHLWHPLKLSERQGDYLSNLKVNVAMPSKNVILQTSSAAPSSPIGSPAMTAINRKSTGSPALPPLASPVKKGPLLTAKNVSHPGSGSNSPVMMGGDSRDRSPEIDETSMALDSPKTQYPSDFKHNYDDEGSQTLEIFQSIQDPPSSPQTLKEDPLLRTVDRLRMIAINNMSRGGTERERTASGNYNPDNSMDSSRSSQDSQHYKDLSSRAESKPTLPLMTEGAKPKTKNVYRKYTPQVYSLSHFQQQGTNTSTNPSLSVPTQQAKDEVDLTIDIRTRSFSGSSSMPHYPDDSKESTGTPSSNHGSLSKRRSSEKSEDTSVSGLRNSISSGGSNNGNGSFTNNKTTRCPYCQREFVGVSSNEACDEHQPMCKLSVEMREKFDSLDSSLKVVSFLFFVFCFCFLCFW
jgi:hypothetical protein